VRRFNMSTMVEFSVVPMGEGASVSATIADIMKVVIGSGISYRANPMGTVLEGDWDAVMGLIKECHAVARASSERVITSIKIDDREGAGPRMSQKLASVEKKIGQKLNQ
jgi:uncharacterized protein (TIGR00106 family)